MYKTEYDQCSNEWDVYSPTDNRICSCQYKSDAVDCVNELNRLVHLIDEMNKRLLLGK